MAEALPPGARGLNPRQVPSPGACTRKSPRNIWVEGRQGLHEGEPQGCREEHPYAGRTDEISHMVQGPVRGQRCENTC